MKVECIYVREGACSQKLLWKIVQARDNIHYGPNDAPPTLLRSLDDQYWLIIIENESFF